MQVPEVVLNSGHKMPLIGFGTVGSPLPPPEELISIYINAIECGYRHFDTAYVYGTEEPLGRAVAEALRRGLIESRDQLFITSKLGCQDAHPDLVVPALEKTLQNLGMEYVNLYLVHWPLCLKREVQGKNFSGEDVLPLDIQGTWQAMEECSRLGLAKSVGVSNFSSHKLSKLLQHATITPAVNQVEMNPPWQQQKLRKFCDEKGIHVSAWSPLGPNGASWGTMAVMDSPILKEIATAKGKTVAQVAIRWIYEQGVSPIVKSFNKERMKQNLQVFDWELTEEELGRIQEIPQRRGWAIQSFFSPQGPFKSAEDLWDGDA